MDDEITDELHSRLDLIGEHCHLKHSAEDPAENHPAIDYLCQDFGQEASVDFGHAINENFVSFSIRIPICKECVEALLGEEWVLCYCIHCNSSQWVCKKYSRLQFPFWMHIKWMDECPICYEAEEEFEDDID